MFDRTGTPRPPRPFSRQRPALAGCGSAEKERSVEITGIISALVIGLVIGALGRLVVPGRQQIPIWLTIVIGIVAALIGTAIAGVLGVADTRGIDWIELLLQVALAAGGVVTAVRLYDGRGK
jgi:uncharacterized membrane protein YeaQ/YmgE (transglycosylase-associated protein family)